MDIRDCYMKDVGRHKLLTKAEEQELHSRYKQGDMQALEKLVRNNQAIIVSIANYYDRRSNKCEFGDFISEGNLGLLKSINKFNPEMEYKLLTFALYDIKQTMIRYIENSDCTIRLPGHIHDQIRKIKGIEKDYFQIHQERPSIEYIAEKGNWNVEQVKALMIAKKTGNCASLNKTINDEGEELGMFVEDKNINVEDIVIKNALERAIEESMKILTKREQEVVKRRFGILGETKNTLEEIGYSFGVTRERIRQIENKALNKISKSSHVKSLATFYES